MESIKWRFVLYQPDVIALCPGHENSLKVLHIFWDDEPLHPNGCHLYGSILSVDAFSNPVTSFVSSSFGNGGSLH